MALDLTKDVPRSPFDQLDGYAWLPRMIDKARAEFAGTNGEYSAYPCPGDQSFLKHFGLDPRPLGELIKGGADDAAIAAHVRQHATSTDQAGFARGLQGPLTNPIYKLALFFMRRGLRNRIGASRPDIPWDRIRSFAMLVAAEERHPLP